MNVNGLRWFSMLALVLFYASCQGSTLSEVSNEQNKDESKLHFSESELNKWPKASAEFLASCNSQMTQLEYAKILSLSDVSTFEDFREAAPRAERIAELFAQAKDRRGIFASMYVAITKEAVDSTLRGAYENTDKAAALVKQFATRYFEPLHNHFLNGSLGPGQAKNFVVPEWQTYYKLSEDCNASDLYILGTGVNNHMTYDLPYTLFEIDAPDSFRNDFMEFGNILIKKKRESTDLLQSQQNVFAASFFDLFLLGKVIDSLAPKETAATLGFQWVRAIAWQSSRGLRSTALSKNLAQASISAVWQNRQNILSLMPRSTESMKGTEQ